jgi:hypothetical protein
MFRANLHSPDEPLYDRDRLTFAQAMERTPLRCLPRQWTRRAIAEDTRQGPLPVRGTPRSEGELLVLRSRRLPCQWNIRPCRQSGPLSGGRRRIQRLVQSHVRPFLRSYYLRIAEEYLAQAEGELRALEREKITALASGEAMPSPQPRPNHASWFRDRSEACVGPRPWRARSGCRRSAESRRRTDKAFA